MKFVSENLNEYQNHIQGGKGDMATINDVDSIQLLIGTAVEMEHTDDKEIAQEIAIDHLVENPEYYTILLDSGLVDEPEAIELYNKLISKDNVKPELINDELMNEEITQWDVDQENRRRADILDEEDYWHDVADAMGADLVGFDVDDRGRIITIKNNTEIVIYHDWYHDGTPTKPLTTINVDGKEVVDLGRNAIWEDPNEYANDIMRYL